MSRCAPRLALRPLTLSIALAFSAATHAATVTASATYSLDGGAVNTLVQGPSSGSVDVLEFTGNPSSAGIHTYGSSDGSFGSRSSGYGVYDVTGLFVIEQTVVNTSSIAQNAIFNFEITPGTLQNDIRSLLQSGEYVAAGLTFNIQANGNSVWGSSASLRTDATGTTYQQTGADIYTPAAGAAPTTYSVDGGHFSVDLGVVNAGESLTLRYALSTFASGVAPGHPGEVYSVPQQTVEIPGRTVFVPEQTYQYWSYDGSGYGYGGYGGDVVTTTATVADAFEAQDEPIVDNGYGGGYGGVYCGGGYYTEGSGSCMTVVTPAYTYELSGYTYYTGGYTYTGANSGSMASSGDPFDIYFGGGNTAYGPASVTLTTAVPEPSTYVLMFACLAIMGLTVRRRQG